ncbi:glycosyltransferase family 4 protein [Pseudaminobacter sp. NGMCC 1.201702]|uniref:glycosyltransferase family 4 protein n=1 Tax=Pseudaminobacter sp. NGMCC 1.201702 TaxID=3391825 RepID=UPI0039EEC3C5
MRIAFYAPLKSPDHPVASGDRQMARLLINALRRGGHHVELVSQMRGYVRQPDRECLDAIKAEAETEIDRLTGLWKRGRKPDLWFCYHPYYKAPDLIGPALSARFAISYVTAEASYSRRRNLGSWAETQRLVAAGVEQAALNICFTKRDREGLSIVAPGAVLGMLPPFIDTSPFVKLAPSPCPSRLVTVAMMRPGDKLESYRMLARALQLIADPDWSLSVVGDGPSRAEVFALFAGIPSERITWHGEVEPDEVPAILCQGGIYVWPGYGEAYGVAYLEAQAAGLPVVAQNVAGVPEVVRNRRTGLLTAPDDVPAFAAAIASLLTHNNEKAAMAEAARRFVLEERSLEIASKRLAELFRKAGVS